MNETHAGESRPKAPIHLWIVGALALLWSLMGAFDYLATQLELEFYMSQFTPEQLAYFNAFPTWMTAFWAFGVWGGFAGSIGLLLRKKWAVWAYVVSIAGLFVSSIYNFGVTDGAEIMGSEAVIFTIIIWIAALFLLGYTWMQAKRGVLT